MTGGYRAGAPPGKRSGPGNRPAHSNADHLTKGLDVDSVQREAVLVVHVICGMVTWRRVFITAEGALSYADRMRRRGHEAEVRAAILVGGAWS